MWYENSYRRHLLDMHIDDWDPAFLSEFSPEEYVKNLKAAKIQSAMIYLQSHVGLCNYPTKTGKIHNAFVGREDTFRRLIDMCRAEGIAVTGYYSLIYNNWAYDNYPEWRMVKAENVGKAPEKGAFRGSRYGLVCPNNPDYLKFTEAQIREMAEYADFDGMFYDMLFWPRMCHCEHCRARYLKETGEELPTVEDWSDEKWLLHMRKRREWMGEFANWVTDLTKSVMPGVSVEHNVAFSALPDGKTANAEEVISACDYVGGDLDRGVYGHSFTCKFYRSISKNQPFEHMFTRCLPGLSAHTQIKSPDIMKSAFFLTAAHHGATLLIDAIDPVGTMDARVYKQLGEVFSELIPYEPYYKGEPIEDVGLYYSLKSKFNPNGEEYTNYIGVTQALETMIENNILCGITGGYADLGKYKTIVAPCLTSEDDYDVDRLIKYVKDGGNLYFSGAGNKKLIEKFFGATANGRTNENVVYIAPTTAAQSEFEYFNEKYPLNFKGTAPVVEGIGEADVIATLTLPYTARHEPKFASIHSDPPGKPTNIPAIAAKRFGKGRVIWSALPIECQSLYDYRRIFINLLGSFSGLDRTLESDAADDIEITAFKTEDSILLNTVLMTRRHTARRVEDINVALKTDFTPLSVKKLPDGENIDFDFDGKRVNFKIKGLKIFEMIEIK